MVNALSFLYDITKYYMQTVVWIKAKDSIYSTWLGKCVRLYSKGCK